MSDDKTVPMDFSDPNWLSTMPRATRADIEKASVEQEAYRAVRHQWPYPKDMDWLLAHIVNLADTGLEFSLTVNVRGLIVSGIAISGAKYIEQMAAFMRSTAPAKEFGDILAERVEEFAEVYKPRENEKGELIVAPPNYVHLREARYLEGARSAPVEGTLWRGRISSVDGFAYGSLKEGAS